MPKVQFGSRLRELRRERGLPISVLARLAKVSTTTITHHEKWGLPLPKSSAERIAEVLRVPLSELLVEGGDSDDE